MVGGQRWIDVPEDFHTFGRNRAIRNTPGYQPSNNALRTILNPEGYRQQFC